MATLLDLPTEILVQITQHASFNGDLPRFRQVNSRLNDISKRQSQRFLEDLCKRYDLSARVVDLYFTRRLGTASMESSEPRLVDVIALDHFLRGVEIVAADVDKALQSRQAAHGARPYRISRESFLLFAVLSQLLSLSKTVLSMTGTVLAPCHSGETFAPKVPSDEFARFLQSELALLDLESIIVAINVCATRLWSTIFLFRPTDMMVTSFGSLSGYSFNTHQAILAEHTIWKGPKWVSQTLERCNESTGDPSHHKETQDPLINRGIWNGSHENGALLAANGMVRMLWKERQDKIE
ncbi:uncharacterized protein A1O9_03988, partial [Exophiala aquamarina CBS 119918]